jgi:hypothetical protein
VGGGGGGGSFDWAANIANIRDNSNIEADLATSNHTSCPDRSPGNVSV